MNVISREDFQVLIAKPSGWRVSIYMPTHRVFPEAKQDQIRFENLLRSAESKLEAAGLRSTDAKKMLEPGDGLVKGGFFKEYQGDGLALFISSDSFYHYRLPLSFDELVVVADRFHVKPLIPLITLGGRFYVLALSQNEVKLFQGDRHGLREMDLGGTPRSRAEALKYDDPQRQLQFHTRAPGAGGERAAMFHGQGVGKDDAKDGILRFFQQLDQGLHALMREESAPLLLAGVDYLFPIYRQANSYPRLVEQGIAGNPENLKVGELHERAWQIIEPHFLSSQKDAMAGYKRLAGSGRVSRDIKEIIEAACSGKIETLFVAVGVQRWGVTDQDGPAVQLHDQPEPGDEDLLDLAAVRTYANKGTVYALKPEEMPDGASLAAIFRY
jgi:hypothetical protein